MDHFAVEEKDAYECTRNVISTLNFQLPVKEDEEDIKRRKAEEEPLYSSEELLGLAARSYSYTIDVKMVKSVVMQTCRAISGGVDADVLS